MESNIPTIKRRSDIHCVTVPPEEWVDFVKLARSNFRSVSSYLRLLVKNDLSKERRKKEYMKFKEYDATLVG
jgi:hypothetical protein